MSTSSPRKKLPVNPSLEYLQKLAKRRAKQDPALQLAAAQQQLAREYGCTNWAELAHVVATMARGADQLVNVQKAVEPLPQAARRGDLAEVRRLLAAGPFTQHDLDQALAHALWYGDAAGWPARKVLADVLLDHGADPDGQYGSGYGPLVFGVGECLQPEALDYLIAAGADVAFAPLATKYGPQCPLSQVLGTYLRGCNERKHRCIELLLLHGAFVPPAITPPVLALHRGDVNQLAACMERDPGLATARFPEMPHGNMALPGATLLHAAVEFGEIECLDLLCKHGADLNAGAMVRDGVGGQTPVFHAIATNMDDNFPTLEHLARHYGPRIDGRVRATWRRHGDIQAQPMTPLEFAEHAARTEDPAWRRKVAEEHAILRALA